MHRTECITLGLLPVLFAFLGEPLDRSHLFTLGRREDDYALGRTAGDANAVDRAADQLSGVFAEATF